MMRRSSLIKLAVSLPLLAVLVLTNGIAELQSLPLLLIALLVALGICEPLRLRLMAKSKAGVAMLPFMGAALVLMLAYCWKRDLLQAILLLITIGVVFDILLIALAAIGEVTKRGFRGIMEFFGLLIAGLVLGAILAIPFLLLHAAGRVGP